MSDYMPSNPILVTESGRESLPSMLGSATLEELGATSGTPPAVVDELVSDSATPSAGDEHGGFQTGRCHRAGSGFRPGSPELSPSAPRVLVLVSVLVSAFVSRFPTLASEMHVFRERGCGKGKCRSRLRRLHQGGVGGCLFSPRLLCVAGAFSPDFFRRLFAHAKFECGAPSFALPSNAACSSRFQASSR